MNVEFAYAGSAFEDELSPQLRLTIRWSKQEIKPSGPIAPGKSVLAVVECNPSVFASSVRLMQ